VGARDVLREAKKIPEFRACACSVQFVPRKNRRFSFRRIADDELALQRAIRSKLQRDLCCRLCVERNTAWWNNVYRNVAMPIHNEYFFQEKRTSMRINYPFRKDAIAADAIFVRLLVNDERMPKEKGLQSLDLVASYHQRPRIRDRHC